jgi:hypothetical protein
MDKASTPGTVDLPPYAANKIAKAQQREEAARLAPAEPPAIIDKAHQGEIIQAADAFSWRAEDVKRLLAAHGFAKSAQVTVDKLPAILEALKNGDVIPVTTEVGVLQPDNALAI